MFFPMDATLLLLIPAVILALWAQMRISSTFRRYSQVSSARGVRASEAARRLLDRFGLNHVAVERVPGSLTDHYDPRSKVLRLSDDVYGSTSIAAIGVAAHEAGHAVQDLQGYAPLRIRNAIVPVTNLGSTLAMPLFFLGIIMRIPALMDLGILLFAGILVFHLVTLPVEFDASSRALRLLGETQVLGTAEIAGARRVLNAAALTYVAATVMAAVQLLRLLLLRGRDE
ncbi:MAG TPA: zinc metallopeptidase [Synergistaceae bacterium]|nr:zinc metallopeptidase [Synergistaceae bacterium]HQH78260.1 zinc metallopeptidase [Synergistaceae bacterium]HQK25244.1 zinc metallopeptidase [Synergistaceae bacterium]